MNHGSDEGEEPDASALPLSVFKSVTIHSGFETLVLRYPASREQLAGLPDPARDFRPTR
jgi:hypothetical protein